MRFAVLPRFSGRALLSGGLIASLLVAGIAVGAGLWARNIALAGKPEVRAPEEHHATGLESVSYADAVRMQRPIIVLAGDSHAAHLLPAVSLALSRMPGQPVLSAAMTTACPPIDGVVPVIAGYRQYKCTSDVSALWERLASANTGTTASTGVILAARWTVYIARPNTSTSEPWVGQLDMSVTNTEQALKLLEAKLREHVEVLRARGVKTLLVLSPPELRHVPAKCLARLRNDQCGVTLTQHLEHQRPVREVFQRLAAIDPDMIQVYDPTVVFCTNGMCLPQRDGRVLYNDSNHIGEAAAQDLATHMAPALSWLLTSD
jgi:hypothetical protein